MPRVLVLLLLSALLGAGCAGIRKNSRKPVEGTPAIISSPYAPEDDEGCREVVGCPYFNFTFSTVQEMCAERVAAQAREAGADYIRVNEPKQSVGGFNTRNPRAIFYDCDALSD